MRRPLLPVLMLGALGLAASSGMGCAPAFHGSSPPGAPAGSTFASVDRVPVRYQSVGQGPAVVLVHGYGSSLDIWERVAARLSKKHRVISVDLKGFGFTGRPSGDYSPSAQAAMVWKLLDQLAVKDVAIVGHSWGSSVVMAMALAKPSRVRRIALYSAYVYEAQVPSFFRWARKAGVGEVLFRLFYKERIEDRVMLAYYDKRWITQARIDRIQREMKRPGTVAGALAAARGQRYSHVEKRYRTVRVPALLLWGENDRVTPLGFGRRLASDLPDSRLVTYPRCGHLPMVEAFSQTTRDLAGFLAEDIK